MMKKGITDYEHKVFQDLILKNTHKGAPSAVTQLAFHQVAAQSWNIINDDFPMPLALIKQSKIKNNSRWMQDFISKSGVDLAPHGKTTMSPQLFHLQLNAGAWGMTFANVHQIRVARTFGINKIILANQLIGKQACTYIINALKEDPDFEFYCLVDNAENIAELCGYARNLNLQENGIDRRINVLLEVGMKNGRTGVQSSEEALKLAQLISTSHYLSLGGIECYEGVIHEADPHYEVERVVSFLNTVLDVTQKIEALDYFNKNNAALILSGGGTAFYDLVAHTFKARGLGNHWRILIRPGCYLSHDSGIYQAHQARVLARDLMAQSIPGALESAIELWAYVQSLPEPGLAILSFGKRDVSFDAGLPIPTKRICQSNSELIALNTEATKEKHYVIFDINDQHAFMSYPNTDALKVGDRIAMDISHPCLTFDKWQVMPVVDDEYQVVDMIQTFF